MPIIYRLIQEDLTVTSPPQTIFSITYDPIGDVTVYVNGLKLIEGGDYTFTGTKTFSLTTPALAGDVVSTVYVTTNNVSSSISGVTILNTINNNGDCTETFIKDGLISYFDISNVKSWNGNLDFTIKSLYNWSDSIFKPFTLKDYGLTQYDIGQADTLSASTSFTYTDNIFCLNRIGENDASGNTSYSAYTISGKTGTTGNYFELSGGWLSNFFKLDGFPYELLPYRYIDGFTIETWMRVDDNTFSNINEESDGYFLFLGTRAENKYYTRYSGETGNTTSSGATLGSDHPNSPELGVFGNVLGFKFNANKQIGYKLLDDDGVFKQEFSNSVLGEDSWMLISLSFRPKGRLSNRSFDKDELRDVLDCVDRRTGDLSVYINGRRFHTFEDFIEPKFSALSTSPDKQIGVPYTLSWGGGAFGLKHSWHYEGTGTTATTVQDVTKQNLAVEQIFDGSFYGGIQKLRIYNRALSTSDIRHNFNVEASNFGINPFRGGRLIYI